MPEEGEDSMTGWVTVRGKECQVETEKEEMETPEVRRIVNPVPPAPERKEGRGAQPEVVGGERGQVAHEDGAVGDVFGAAKDGDKGDRRQVVQELGGDVHVVEQGGEENFISETNLSSILSLFIYI